MEQFADIFKKLEQVNTKPISPVQEVWREIAPDVYQCKITGRKLAKVQFLRLQDRIGMIGFVVEVLVAK